MKYSFYTLGCKVNQYETQAMEQLLLERGHTLGDFDEACDCYVINTCTVTAVSDKKCRAVIRRVRRQNPDAVIGVCGCYAQNAPEDVRKLGVDVLIGTQDRLEFLDRLEQAVKERQHWEKITDAKLPREFEILPAGGLAARTRALLKVEDGCNNFCSYCIIPYARGRVRSLPLETAVSETKRLAQEGYRELVVNGIEISSWGQDLPGRPGLRELLLAVCQAAPELRIRLGSLEPRTIDRDFCQTLSGCKNLCPQFHLSLQSGSDTVLKRMNRKYDTARYLESVRLLHQFFPGCAVTTDLIVGFPGETEEEFQQSLDFIRLCGLSKVHIFPYSKRAGTPAAKMEEQLSNEEKARRASRAAQTAEELETAFQQALRGTVQQVLFEQIEDGLFTGHAPNYVKVYARGQELHNQVRTVKITDLYLDGVLGELE